MFECKFEGCNSQFHTENGLRVHKNKPHTLPYNDPENLEQLVDKGYDEDEIAEKLDVDPTTVRYNLSRHGIV